MEQLKAKLKKQGGFTMVELLIVVAIIAILVAVSIPMFSNALEKARHGVDQANCRDVISLAYAEYLGSADPKTEFKNAVSYSYEVADDHSAELVKNGTDGETPQCTCGHCAAADELGVTIKYNTTSGKPDIELTGWSFSSTDGYSSTITAP